MANGCQPGSIDSDEEDWAVLELDEPVSSSIIPYKTDKDITNRIDAGKALVSVGKSDDFKVKGTDGTNLSHFPRHYTDCATTEVRRLFSGDDPNLFNTNCPMNHMNSGGGLFDMSSGIPVLVGITVGALKADNARFFVSVSRRLAQTLRSLKNALK